MELEQILERVRQNLDVQEHSIRLGELSVVLNHEDILPACRWLHDDPDLAFDYLTDVTAVDWLPRDPRFDVVYQLYSMRHNHLLRLRLRVNEEDEVESVTPVWKGANWLEREVLDLMGIRFKNHPDPRRIFLPQNYRGHPLRKDFSVTEGMNDDTLWSVD